MAFAAFILTLAISATTYAACPVFPDVNTSKAVGAGSNIATVSNLAFGTYFLQIATLTGGTAPVVAPGIQALPGIFQSGKPGFIGTGATLVTSWSLLPSATVGTFRDVRVKIVSVNGSTVCQDIFRVTVVP